MRGKNATKARLLIVKPRKLYRHCAKINKVFDFAEVLAQSIARWVNF